MNVLWRGGFGARVRIVSGLILMLYALLHMLNLGFALISPDIANALQGLLSGAVGTLPGTILLYGAILSHMVFALARLTELRRIQISLWTLVQYAFGLLIPTLLLTHIVFTRLSEEIYGTEAEFGYISGLIWDTQTGWQQAALLMMVWIHGCIGLHMWLRLTRWWRAWLPMLTGVAVLVPAWALAGFLSEGRRVTALLSDPEWRPVVFEEYNWPTNEALFEMVQIRDVTHWVFYAALGLTFVIWLARRILGRRGQVIVSYVEGPEVAATKGMTLLEISQGNGVPHAALCGGRGRCSTCRVIVEEGAELLDPPSPAEAATLQAVNAPPGSRLACQIRPTEPMTVFRVFRPDGRRDRAHASQGEERQLAILFLDIRGFTSLTAGQLPYDVVFLLNRFFDAVVPQITGVGGTVDKYLGDGLLAVFEQGDAKSSAQSALQAAEGIGSALISFNATVKAEGGTPIRIGIGLHLGELVVGEIGAVGHAPKTIIGDTVNAASRLEGETKAQGVELLVSGPLLSAAGYDVSKLDLTEFALRGRDSLLSALPVKRAVKLSACLAPAAAPVGRAEQA